MPRKRKVKDKQADSNTDADTSTNGEDKGVVDIEELETAVVEELENLLRNGRGRVWYDRQGNRIRVKDRIIQKTWSLPYEQELYDRLRKAYAEGAEALKGQGLTKKSLDMDVRLWTQFIGKKKPLIESIVAKVGWVQDAILDIGMNTLLLTILTREPEEADNIPQILGRLKDRDQMVGFVMGNLISIYAASRGAKEVQKLYNERAALMMENAILDEENRRLREQVEELNEKLSILLSIMPESALRKYAMLVTTSSIGKYLVTPPERAEAPPEEVSEGEE